ncbi:hypothetical protein BHM03_00059315 [Ensete ventricosum]|uniref:Iron hydrogenase small subunit domain-containing protein n=1 Tax=Ensete ventricosum TaxID=4639 RepID=A0A426Y6R2_ENSVE|nr:hypothetical protein B296_00053887 [Ensete ventricosum]RZS26023.1 hypothetical protein BHM03_00059315 [Ensete ventricosum]
MSSSRPDNVYHVTVMPCYDKKLEAARDEFSFSVDEGENGHANSVMKIPEVDSVLTSGEVLDLIQVEVADPFDNSIVKRLYDEWLGQPGSEKARRYLHTEYHPLVKSTASQLLNW